MSEDLNKEVENVNEGEELDNIIILNDEDGNEVRFEFLDLVELEDEEYVVVKPETPYDLVVEGTTLGHCVGGYINKVVDRKTNIMFIRKIQDPTKPLFTVEILSNGVIEQIHGRYNSNIDDKKVVEEEPNLTKFVATWVKEKKLELHTINKVR